MSVHLDFVGRLGNNLFQYAFARVVAETLGYRLTCGRSGPVDPFCHLGLMAGPTVTLEGQLDVFPHVQLTCAGAAYSEPIESHDIRVSTAWSGHTVDVAALLANRTPRQIRLCGYFQRIEYYLPYEDRIRQWFRPVEIPTVPRLEPGDIVVNIRRAADFAVGGWQVSVDYYLRALDQMTSHGRVVVCGVGVDEQIRRALAPYQPIYAPPEPMNDFRLLLGGARLIIANSTFSWWAAFLSGASRICVPRRSQPNQYAFVGYRDVDLHMRSERFIEVDSAPGPHPTADVSSPHSSAQAAKG